MAANNSDRDQRIQFEERVWNLRQKGYTQARIAAEVGRNQGVISRALRRIYARALARLDKFAAHHRARQVELLDHIIDEALQAWERSKKPKKRSTRQSGGKGESATAELQERDGDPAFLATAMDAMRDQRKLLNLDVPPDAEAVTGVDLRAALATAEASDAAYRPDPEPTPEGSPDETAPQGRPD